MRGAFAGRPCFLPLTLHLCMSLRVLWMFTQPPAHASFDLPPVPGGGAAFGGGLSVLLQTEDLMRPHEPPMLAPLVVPPKSSLSSETAEGGSSSSSASSQQEQAKGSRSRDAGDDNGPSPVASDLSSPSVSPTEPPPAKFSSQHFTVDINSIKQQQQQQGDAADAMHPAMAAPLAVRPRFEPPAEMLEGIGCSNSGSSSIGGQQVFIPQPPGAGGKLSMFQPRPPAAARPPAAVAGATALTAPQFAGRRRQFLSSRGGADADSGGPTAAAQLAELRGGTGSARLPAPPPPKGTTGGVLLDSRAPPPPTPPKNGGNGGVLPLGLADGGNGKGLIDLSQLPMMPRPPECPGASMVHADQAGMLCLCQPNAATRPNLQLDLT